MQQKEETITSKINVARPVLFTCKFDLFSIFQI